MTDAGIEIVEYRAAFRTELVDLWGRLFAGRRHFRPLDRATWVREIERSGFDPCGLRVAFHGDRVIGFAHGGVWQGDFLRHYRPHFVGDRLPYLAMVGVAPEMRRRGVGRALVSALATTFGARVEPDGRMFNPFYGNSAAPRPPLWGTTEGAAVPIDDAAARGFFRALGFAEVAEAHSQLLNLTAAARTVATGPSAADVEIISERDYLPALGTSTGRTFGETNVSRTWIAVEGTVQRAALVAYPFATPAAGADWAIYSLEVEPAARGRGLGTVLLRAFLRELREELQARTVETLVIPAESPAALRLYTAHGFESVARWIVLGAAGVDGS
ncbi:MAG: N-acetyltransferase family protein [Planctomycetota bacterium]